MSGTGDASWAWPWAMPWARPWSSNCRVPSSPSRTWWAAGSFTRRDPPEIRGSGYVVASLEAALWAFHRSTSFRVGAHRAVNLGDDADTTGAVYSQLAGGFYGEAGIPEAWRTRLAQADLIL